MSIHSFAPKLLAGLSLAAISTVAFAQEAAPSNSGFDEIVVTAQRRSESLQHTAIAVSALNADALQQQSISTEQDLMKIPGLLIKQGWDSNQLNFSIRGQTIDQFTGSAPAVQPYLNDIPATTVVGSSFYDLKSIQVLKGPQGTLFGRNVTGGAVLYTTATPTDTLEGYVMGRYGNYDRKTLEASLNLPVVSEKIALRVAGVIDRRDGFTLDLVHNQRLGNIHRQSFRTSLLIAPTETFRNTLVLQYDKSTGTGTPPVLYSAYPTSLFIPANLNAIGNSFGFPNAWAAYVAAHPAADPNGVLSFLQVQRARGPFRVSFDAPNSDRATTRYLSNTTEFDLTDDIQFKNIFGYIKSKHAQSIDEDGSPFGIVGPTVFITANRQITEEAQLLGKTGNLSYVAGLFYLNNRQNDDNRGNFFDLGPLLPVTIARFIDRYTVKTKAAYAQATYDLGDATGVGGLSVTAGARYTSEKARLEALPGSALFGIFGTTRAANTQNETTKKVSYQFGIQDQVNSDLLLYAVTRRSFRSGGFNIYAAPFPGNADVGGNGFDPEVAKDVELGVKYQGRAGDIPVRANLAVYQQWISNIQRAAFVLDTRTNTQAGLTVNVPKSRVRGFELETQVNPTPWLELGFNLAYTDAVFTQGTSTLFGQSLTYGPYADAPKWSGTVFAQVSHELPDSMGTLVFRGDVFGQTKFYFGPLNNTRVPGTEIPGYKLVDLRAGVDEIAGTGLSINAYAKNLFNKVYWAGGIPGGAQWGQNVASPGAPRTYYIEARYKF